MSTIGTNRSLLPNIHTVNLPPANVSNWHIVRVHYLQRKAVIWQ
jgi:hypothetical protein